MQPSTGMTQQQLSQLQQQNPNNPAWAFKKPSNT